VAKTHRGTKIAVTMAGQSYGMTISLQAKLSLQTSEKSVAVERHREVSAQLANAYAKLQQSDAQGPVRLTDRQCGEIAGEYFKKIKDQYRENPGEPEDWDGGNSAACDLGETAKGRESMHGQEADEVLVGMGVRLIPESREQLLTAMHRAYLDAAFRVERWASGSYAAMENGEEKYPPKMTISSRPALTLADVRDEWVRDREAQGKAAASISMFRHYFASLIEFLGKGDQRDATTVTPDNIEDWLKWLEREKVGRQGKPLSRKTIGDGYLTLVKAGFEKSRRKLPQWPFEGIKFTIGKKKNERPKGLRRNNRFGILRLDAFEAA